MDLNTVRSVRQPRQRTELVLRAGEAFLAGGTWLYSEPQPAVTGVVDLTFLRWPSIEITTGGLELAATCTLSELLNLPARPGWLAHPLFAQCINSLVASFKIWKMATVGGNLCTTLPAGALISLTAALDATLVIWALDGSERTLSVVDFILGAQHNALRPGEVLRSILIGVEALRSRTAYRKIALTPLGRSGSLVIGRVDPQGEAVITVTAATERPHQFRYPALPDAETLLDDLSGIEVWYDDPHGSPAWRAHVTRVLAEEVRSELHHGGGAQ